MEIHIHIAGFRKTTHVLKRALVCLLIVAWVFSGWPQIDIKLGTLSIQFPPTIEYAYADTVIFTETCGTSPAASLDNSTTATGGTWSAEILLAGTDPGNINSGTSVCSATSDSTNDGIAHTISIAPTTHGYYMRADLIDAGNIATTDNQGILMNYIDVDNFYACSYNDDPADGALDVYIRKVSGAAGSELGSAANVSGMTSGDEVECKIIYTDGTPTITITNITDASEYLTATDSTSPLTETKKAGVYCGAMPAQASTDCEDALDMDNIEL